MTGITEQNWKDLYCEAVPALVVADALAEAARALLSGAGPRESIQSEGLLELLDALEAYEAIR